MTARQRHQQGEIQALRGDAHQLLAQHERRVRTMPPRSPSTRSVRRRCSNSRTARARAESDDAAERRLDEASRRIRLGGRASRAPLYVEREQPAEAQASSSALARRFSGLSRTRIGSRRTREEAQLGGTSTPPQATAGAGRLHRAQAPALRNSCAPDSPSMPDFTKLQGLSTTTTAKAPDYAPARMLRGMNEY